MAAAGLMLPVFNRSGFAATAPDERWLRLYNIHTGESLKACIRSGDNCPKDELSALNHFFRDFRTGDVKSMDLGLLEILHSISTKTSPNATMYLISGYRSPVTNQKLGKKDSDVARKSFHMQGRAADIRIPGLATADLKNVALGLKAGGVGYYPESGFVHVDTGPVRQW